MTKKETKITIQLEVTKGEYLKLIDLKGTKISWYELLVKPIIEKMEK